MGLISGPKGEALFAEPLMRYFRSNPLPDLFKKTEGLADDRLLALVTALIVENRLDVLNRAFLPRYDRLADAKNEFTFSLKTRLAETLAMVPTRILTAAHIIRGIRNDFAHNLDLERFDQLDSKLLRKLTGLRSEVYGQFGPEDLKPKESLKAEFSALAFFCIVGLEAYADNLATLRRKIETPQFLEGLLLEVRQEEEAALQEVTSKPPLSVEVRDGQRIERYENGVVKITI